MVIMNRAHDNQIESIVYVLLMLTGPASIGPAIQPTINFDLQGALFYSIFAILPLLQSSLLISSLATVRMN